MSTQFLIFAVAAIIVAVTAYRLGKMSRDWRKQSISNDAEIQMSTVCSSKDSSLERDLILLKNYSLDDALGYFNQHVKTITALQRLLDLYQVERTFPDLSHFRLGPNMFDKIVLDWIIIHDSQNSRLVAHGITTKIAWDQDKETLSGGWQGVVRSSYLHSHIEQKKPDTLVGLFIFVEDDFRQQGWANDVILEMRSLAQEKGLRALIIPLRPPLCYKKEYASMPMAEFAGLKREDGYPLDHWVRLHIRLGARILKASETSHQHVMALQDFYDQFSQDVLPDSGDVLIERNGEWYNVFVDRKRDFVLINQGCVWVQHEL